MRKHTGSQKLSCAKRALENGNRLGLWRQSGRRWQRMPTPLRQCSYCSVGYKLAQRSTKKLSTVTTVFVTFGALRL